MRKLFENFHIFYFQKRNYSRKYGTQRKLLNFEFWINGELSKIGHHFSNKKIQKMILSKHINTKNCAPKLVFFNQKKIEKDSDDF
jgi:hypothetical protein